MVLVFPIRLCPGTHLLAGVLQLSPAMPLPMGWAYAAIPIGCFFMALEMLGLLTATQVSRGPARSNEPTGGFRMTGCYLHRLRPLSSYRYAVAQDYISAGRAVPANPAPFAGSS